MLSVGIAHFLYPYRDTICKTFGVKVLWTASTMQPVGRSQKCYSTIALAVRHALRNSRFSARNSHFWCARTMQTNCTQMRKPAERFVTHFPRR